MTADPDRERLAQAKMDAWERYMATDGERTTTAWSTYLDAWQALHEYDRARWNATHDASLQVAPHPTGDTA